MTKEEFLNSKYWLFGKTYGPPCYNRVVHLCDQHINPLCGVKTRYYEATGQAFVRIEKGRFVFAENGFRDDVLSFDYPVAWVCKKCVNKIQ